VILDIWNALPGPRIHVIGNMTHVFTDQVVSLASTGKYIPRYPGSPDSFRRESQISELNNEVRAFLYSWIQ